MGEESSKFQPSFKPTLRWAVIAAIIGSLAASGFGFYKIYQMRQQTALQPAPAPPTPITSISALGRLEPEGEVIKLSASSSGQGSISSRVERLLVQEGDKVQQGQLIAVLDNRDRLQAALERSKQQVKVAEANLAKVKAGAKSGEIAAQQAEIARLQAQRRREIDNQEAEVARLQAQQQRDIDVQQASIIRLNADLDNAKLECDRYEQLFKEGAVTTSSRDSKCLEYKNAQQRLKEAQSTLKRIEETTLQQIKGAQANLNRIRETGLEEINSAKANLNRIAEVRPVDVEASRAELNSAIAALKQAQADLDTAYVKSPLTGQVLKIHTRSGESISAENGIAELGKTGQMYMVAEVYESDIGKVQQGQKVIITSKGFDWKLNGTVDLKGVRVAKKDVLDTDPAADVDARVIEVKIRIDPEDSQKVTGLTNLQVEAKIEL